MTGFLILALLQAAPQSPAVPDGATLVVTNKQEASASIIDVASGMTLATLPTGDGPHETAISPDGRWAVVADYGAGTPGSTLTVLDLSTHTVANTISLGEHRRPHGLWMLDGDSLVVVTVEVNRAALVVNYRTGALVRRIGTEAQGSHMVAVRQDGRIGYTANIGPGSISEIDLVTGELRRSLVVAPRTEGVGVLPDGSQVWVGSNTDNTVTVIDTKTWTAIDTLPAPGLPYRVSVARDGRTLVVPTPMAGAIVVFDAATRERRGTINFGGGEPVGTALSPDGRFAFVSLQGTDEVAMVDLKSMQEVRRFPTGDGPDGIAVAWPM